MTFTVSTGTASAASLSYPATEAYKGGTVYVYNRTHGAGVFELVHADGGIGPTQPLPAELGNQIVVSIDNNEQTVSTCVVLKDGTQSGYCP